MRRARVWAGGLVVSICAMAWAGGQSAGGAGYLPPAAVEKLALLEGHPRLSLRTGGSPGWGRSVEQLRALYREDGEFRKIFDKALGEAAGGQEPAMLAACWAVSGEERYAAEAVALLLKAPVTRSGSGSYSNVWSFALAWDWLYEHRQMEGGRREAIAARIEERLETELQGLDDGGMAMWHGRNQAANGAMVAALAVGDRAGQERQLARAAAHYAEALRAYDYSEGWPEGPSYWIHNRAAPYAVAADCFMTATGRERIAGIEIRQVMRKMGLWTLYQYGPDGVFEPYGDAGYSLPLGRLGYWEMSADYAAKLARDPALAAGADYFRGVSPDPYGRRALHWYAALAYDPTVRPAEGYDRANPQAWMRAHLKQAMLFGRKSLGVAFFRGRWGDADELYATFKAGDLLAHHDHYDVGHFSIQRGGLLAPLTGVYDGSGYTSDYRLGYAIQTVASNSLLILAPGEGSRKLEAARPRGWTALSGGQRVINPTGFDCESVAHFEAQRRAGPHLERAEITAFESAAGRYDYIAADLTEAYNSTRYAEPGSAAKVRLVTRQFLYLRDEEAFVVYDRVDTTAAGYVAKFLLHSLSKPRSASERLLAGPGAEDGILETRERRLVSGHERGVLTQVVVLPRKARTLKIGGAHYRGYVEAGGDQSKGFKGVNLEPQKPPRAGESKQVGLWRTEVEPEGGGERHRFMNVLLPRLASDGRALPGVESVAAGTAADAVRVGATVVVFAREAEALRGLVLKGKGVRKVLVVDARPGGEYRMNGERVKASEEGVVEFAWPGGAARVRLEGAGEVGN